MRKTLILEMTTPELRDGDIVSWYFIEALHTYLKGFEAGAFGNRTSEKLRTITGVRLVATQGVEENEYGA
jgi:hypothetical protein